MRMRARRSSHLIDERHHRRFRASPPARNIVADFSTALTSRSRLFSARSLRGSSRSSVLTNAVSPAARRGHEGLRQTSWARDPSPLPAHNGAAEKSQRFMSERYMTSSVGWWCGSAAGRGPGWRGPAANTLLYRST